VNLAQKSIQKATNGSFKTSSVYAQPMPPEQPNSQFEPGCDANGCYGVPGLQPIWDPILDLECDGSGCHPVYTVRTYEGRDCQLDHFGMTVSGAGRSGSIGRGGGAQYTARDAAYGA